MRSGRIAVFEKPSGLLRLENHPIPKISGGELLARIDLCTLCGSDLHTLQGRRSTPTPTVLGHEILGTIVQTTAGAVGFDGRELQVGDRITWTVAASCGDCFYCKRDLPQKCDSLLKYGHAPITDTWTFNGGLGDYCHLKSGSSIHIIPDDIPDRVACPVNCATATVAAALRGSKIEGRSVLVQGAGMLGVTACAMANTMGAERVLVSDKLPERLDRAKAFGATHLIEAGKKSDSLENIRDATNGYGVDIALELTGSVDAVEIGMEAIRMGGEAIWVGTVHPTDPVKIMPETLVRRMLAVRGVHNYNPSDLDFALRFLEENHRRFPFSELVEKTFALSEVNEAIDYAVASKAFRVAVKP